jgi:hypothetical protein
MSKKKNKTDCKTEGCEERAEYGYEHKVFIACKIHRILEPEELRMVNVKNKRCIKCKKTMDPIYGLEGGEKTHCYKCREPEMVNLKEYKKCFCNRVLPSFGFKKGKANATHCKDCKTEGMFNVTEKKCFCGKHQPVFGTVIRKATHCSSCKTPEMFDVINEICFCGKARPSFGLEIKKSTHCKECKTPEMFNVNCKKCFCGRVQPSFALSGNQASHCYDCKTSGMINVNAKRCLTEHCDTYAWNPNYEDYFMRCFMYVFPDKPIARNYKTKETAMVNYIMERFNNQDWVWDKRIENGISLKRPDLYLNLDDMKLTIECQESHHKSDDCTCINRRIMELSLDVKHIPMVSLYFNPDSYKNKEGKKIESCWGVTPKTGIAIIVDKEMWEKRLKVLGDTIEYWLKNKTEKTVEIIELFHDQD